MIPRIALLVVLAVAGASCEPEAGGVPGTPDQLVDGAWELRVDRTWSRTGIRRPSELTETDYQPVANGATYSIVVSDRGARVTIGSAPAGDRGIRSPLEGTRTVDTGLVIYNLDKGTFAGGRFVVWPGDQALQGELTIYGSGLPIVSSVRGRLAKRDR